MHLHTVAMVTIIVPWLCVLVVASQANRFISRDEKELQFAIFDFIDEHKLEAEPVKSRYRVSENTCTFECLDDPSCESVNYRHDERACDVMATTKYNATLQKASGNKHLFIKSACDLSPCRHGSCHPYINNGSYRCACSAYFTGRDCDTCTGPALGMVDGRIKAQQLSQSSYFQDMPKYGPDRARLNLDTYPHGAHLKTGDVDGGWFNIALNTTKTITAFAMQGYGNPGSIDYVMTFMISTSFDNSSWSFVEHSPGVTKIFPGNTDNNGIVTTTFSPPLITRFFRIVAKTCARACAFRLEVYGCEASTP